MESKFPNSEEPDEHPTEEQIEKSLDVLDREFAEWFVDLAQEGL